MGSSHQFAIFNAYGNNLYFRSYYPASPYTDIMVMDNVGNVGIGVVIPTSQLHTNGSVRFEGITQDNSQTHYIVSDNAGNLFWSDDNFWKLTGNLGTNPNVNFIGTLDNNDLMIRVNNIEKVRVANYGFRVINANMSAYYDNGVATAAQMDDQSTPYGGAGLVDNFAGDSYLRGFWGVIIDKNNAGLGESSSYTNGANPAGGCFAVRTRTTSTTFRTDFMIRYSGNTGIGTTDPRTKLHVNNGDVYLDNSTNGVILTSPNGNCWRVTVDNTGALISTSITCP